MQNGYHCGIFGGLKSDKLNNQSHTSKENSNYTILIFNYLGCFSSPFKNKFVNILPSVHAEEDTTKVAKPF